MFLKVKIGEIPEQFKIGVTETNLVVISNKNICSVVHGSGYCGEDYLTIKKLPYQAVFDYGAVAIEPQVDSIAVQIPFERKSAALDEKKFYADLKKEGLTVQPWLDIVSSVHASVEGTDSVNNRLLKERSIAISRFVAKYFSQSKHVLDSSLAWDKFYKVVRNDEQYNVWASYDKKTISNLLNTKVLSTRMDSILWQTRKTELIFRFYSTKVDTVKAYLSYFTKALHELRTTREISKEEAARLNRIFSHLYRYALKGKVKWQTLSNFSIPSHPDLLTLLNNQNYVMLTHDSSYTSNSRIHQLYQRLVAAGNVTEPHHSAAATYNLINFSIEHRDSGIKVIGLERMVELFNLLGDPGSLGRNLHFLRSSKYFSHHKDWVKRDAVFTTVVLLPEG